MNPKKEVIIFYSIIIALGIGMYSFIGNSITNIFWRPAYAYILYGTLISLFIFGFIKHDIGKKIFSVLKRISHIVFLPVAIIPLLKCYFKVPYVFCKVCPHKCPWGLARPMIIPAFIAINLNKRNWCLGACPFGRILTLQAKISTKIRSFFKKRTITQIIALAFVILVMISSTVYYIIPLNRFFFNPGFQMQRVTLLMALVFLVGGWFVPKLWCNYVCPVGFVGEKTFALTKKMKRKN